MLGLGWRGREGMLCTWGEAWEDRAVRQRDGRRVRVLLCGMDWVSAPGGLLQLLWNIRDAYCLGSEMCKGFQLIRPCFVVCVLRTFGLECRCSREGRAV
jgi:hypothetical protein